MAWSHIIRLLSTKGEWKNVGATVDPGLKHNWIRKGIVRRLGLKAHSSKSPVEEDYNGTRFISTRSVECISSYEQRAGVCRYQFHVVEHLPFDTLIGEDITMAPGDVKRNVAIQMSEG